MLDPRFRALVLAVDAKFTVNISKTQTDYISVKSIPYKEVWAYRENRSPAIVTLIHGSLNPYIHAALFFAIKYISATTKIDFNGIEIEIVNIG